MILNSKGPGGSIKDTEITDGDKVTGTAPFSHISTDTSGNDIYTDPNEVTKTVKSGDAKISSDWAQTTLPANERWRSVYYGNGKFVAIANSSIVAYSTDGVTWEQTTIPTNTYWVSVCYGNGKFVAIAYNTNIAAYSIDTARSNSLILE